MQIRRRFRFLAVGLTLSVVFTGCELFEGLFGDAIDLSMFVGELNDGELTVTVTGLSDNGFERADVWVEAADLDAIDAYLDLEEIDDDQAVENAVEEWMEEEHQMPNSMPTDSADIDAGYGADQTDGDDQVSEAVASNAIIDDGQISVSDDPETTIDGGVYIVYAVVRENSSAQIGVTFAIVDGDSSVSIAYDEGEFEEFTP